MTTRNNRNQPAPPRTLEVITTHLNADFDAMASMVAAKKLYPEALLVFPGSQERNLRDFFIRSSFYFVDFTRMKQVPLEEIKRLILVDTRQASRIGKFADVAATGEVDIHIYDHHPDTDEDVHGSLEVVEEIGSTTAILTRIIRERGISLSPPEATVMALGIFEDTGSFTFASTTPQDFEAGAFLLSQGADLNVISEIVTRELNAEQVALLNDLLEHSTSFHVGGIEVVMARTTAPEYVPDFAVVAHRLMDVENIQVLFALAQMEDRVFVVGQKPPARGGRGRDPVGVGGRGTQLRRLRGGQRYALDPGGGKIAPNPPDPGASPAPGPGDHVVPGEIRHPGGDPGGGGSHPQPLQYQCPAGARRRQAPGPDFPADGGKRHFSRLEGPPGSGLYEQRSGHGGPGGLHRRRSGIAW